MLEAQCNPTQVCSLIAESNYLSFIDQEFVEFLHQPKFFQGKLFSLCQLVTLYINTKTNITKHTQTVFIEDRALGLA